MNAFIDEHRARCGVEPICTALQFAPSYRQHAARQRDPTLLPARAKRDAQLLPEVQRVFDQNLQVYGADKVWRQLHREGMGVARCTVERLKRLAGLRGVRRGKSVRTTVPGAKAACPLDRVKRQFQADRPNQLWVADFTYVSTWQGFVYVAFVIDVFPRYIVGWRVSTSMQTDFVLDALEQVKSKGSLQCGSNGFTQAGVLNCPLLERQWHCALRHGTDRRRLRPECKPFLEHGLNRMRRHRSTEVEPLHLVAMAVLQEVLLTLRLDALCNDLEVQLVPERNDGLCQNAVVGVAG